MVKLRRTGYSIDSLAQFFGADKSSIRHQLHKYGIIPLSENVISVPRIVLNIVKNFKWKLLDGEWVCKEKSYKDYLSPQKKNKSKV